MTEILTAEDRTRMTRLYEEVQTRLEEMAMIVARNLAIPAGSGARVKFDRREIEARSESKTVEILCTPWGCGCYDYEEGACFMSPCTRQS